MSHKEKGQTYDDYCKPGVKNDVTPKKNKIYILVIDPTIEKEFLEKLKLYCQAYYTGMVVVIKHAKENFLEEMKIPNRINDWSG